MVNGAGLMGEAGPEAIMPLRRGSDGRLGVEVAAGQMGGGGHVTVGVEVTDEGKLAAYVLRTTGSVVAENNRRVAPKIAQSAVKGAGAAYNLSPPATQV